jgi:hypothetical protein
MLYLSKMMRIRFRFFFLVPLFAAVLFAGCRSATVLVDEPELPEFMKTFDPGAQELPQSVQELPRGFRFRPESVPLLDIPPDVGTLSEYPSANSNDPVVAAFHEAYVEALLRGLPLEGVLGGDRVHLWPNDNPLGRIQNWISAAEETNSWGFPGLVLAVGSAEDPDGNPDGTYRVHTVSGRILDRYGRSPGPNIGNGVAGYGYPISEVVFRDGAALQNFSKGSIVVDRTGTVFIPLADSEPADPEPSGRVDFSGENLAPEIAGAFSAAVGEVLGADPAARSDGPVVSVVFSDPWIIPGPGLLVSGIYIKSYDAGDSIFVFVDAPMLPKRVRFLNGSFLTILLRSGNRLPGAENETHTAPVSGVESPYLKALLEGFSLYGVPLSDRLAVESDEPGTFQEAQRFSKGWIIAPPFVNEAAIDENGPVTIDENEPVTVDENEPVTVDDEAIPAEEVTAGDEAVQAEEVPVENEAVPGDAQGE